MLNVKVTAKTVRIEIDKATHVFVRAALLGVVLEDVTGLEGNMRNAPPTGKVSIGLAGNAAIGAIMSMSDAQRLVELLTLAMEGNDE